MSQINLCSFINIKFGFKKNSYLWGVQMIEKNNTVPLSMKANVIQKSKWEFRMLSKSYQLSSPKCSFFAGFRQ